MSKNNGLLSDFIGPGHETRDHAGSIFARWGSEDNFFTSGAAVWDRIWGGSKRQRRESRATVISSYADKRDRGGVPAIGAGGGRSRKDRRRVPQIAATATEPGKRQIPNIAGSGAGDRSAPAIGSGQVQVGARGQERSAPDLGGYVVAQGNSPQDRGKRRRGVRRWVAAQFGFRSLSPEEERDMDLFLRRAHQAGHEVPYRQWMSWRASIMLDEMTVMDLWNGPIGMDIQRRYGERGQQLDLPDGRRTGGQVVPEPEEDRVDGVAPSTRTQPVQVPGESKTRR